LLPYLYFVKNSDGKGTGATWKQSGGERGVFNKKVVVNMLYNNILTTTPKEAKGYLTPFPEISANH
jgi:hypothetical protein